MAETKITYGTSTGITLTLNGLASSATVGRCSTAVDNSSTLFADAMITVSITTGSGSMANDKAVYVYLYASEDGTNYINCESGTLGTDAAYTTIVPTIHKLAAVIPVATASKIYTTVFNILSVLGFMPRKWGLIVVNYSGQSLYAGTGETGHIKSFTGITYTTA
jgi:hypothetical protein